MAPSSMLRALTQFFLPKLQFTETNIGGLSRKVYVVTGATSGLRKELSLILYPKNAKVYVTGRTERKAIKSIKAAAPYDKAFTIRCNHPMQNT